eukprot:13103817-Ditylum_brightwellii.AAC.1
MDSTTISTEEITNMVEETNSSTLKVTPSKKRQILLPDRNMEDAKVKEGNNHPNVNSINRVVKLNPNHSTNYINLMESENANKGETTTRVNEFIVMKHEDTENLAKEKPMSIIKKIGAWYTHLQVEWAMDLHLGDRLNATLFDTRQEGKALKTNLPLQSIPTVNIHICGGISRGLAPRMCTAKSCAVKNHKKSCFGLKVERALYLVMNTNLVLPSPSMLPGAHHPYSL